MNTPHLPGAGSRGAVTSEDGQPSAGLSDVLGTTLLGATLRGATFRGATLVVITGTGTEVGKTVVTAALAAIAAAYGQRVAVVKPVQTGVAPGEAADVGTVRSLAGPGGHRPCGLVTTHEFTRLPEPLAPDIAARRAGVRLPPVGRYVSLIQQLAVEHDTVLVEGAGGLLVRLDQDGGTLADLAAALPAARVVVVVGAGLGTLNQSELTVRELRRRGLDAAGLVIGCWPPGAGVAELENLAALPQVTELPLLGVIPHGVAALPPAEFARAAPFWFTAPFLRGDGIPAGSATAAPDGPR